MIALLVAVALLSPPPEPVEHHSPVFTPRSSLAVTDYGRTQVGYLPLGIIISGVGLILLLWWKEHL